MASRSAARFWATFIASAVWVVLSWILTKRFGTVAFAVVYFVGFTLIVIAINRWMHRGSPQ